MFDFHRTPKILAKFEARLFFLEFIQGSKVNAISSKLVQIESASSNPSHFKIEMPDRKQFAPKNFFRRGLILSSNKPILRKYLHSLLRT